VPCLQPAGVYASLPVGVMADDLLDPADEWDGVGILGGEPTM
jgi:hypothetical protein